MFLGIEKATCVPRRSLKALSAHMWMTLRPCLHKQEVTAKAAYVTEWFNTEDQLEILTHSGLGFVVLGLTHARQVLYCQHGKFGVSLRQTEPFLAFGELNSGVRVLHACNQTNKQKKTLHWSGFLACISEEWTSWTMGHRGSFQKRYFISGSLRQRKKALGCYSGCFLKDLVEKLGCGLGREMSWSVQLAHPAVQVSPLSFT